MNKARNFIWVTLLLLLAACNPYPDFEKHEGKLFSKFHSKNGGTRPQVSNVAVIDLVYRTKDSVFYDSRSTGAPISLTINKPDFQGDLNQALQLMAAGDSATFILRADSFFLRTLKYNRVPRGIVKNEVLFLEVKLHRFFTKDAHEAEILAWKKGLKMKEGSQIMDYLSTTKLHPDTTSSGLMVVRQKVTKGEAARPGDKIKVHMTLSLLNGKKVFSSYDKGKPMIFEYGRRIENKGVEEALGMMREGEKLLVIIPSSLAFGDEGRGDFIPPYSPVVYNIEMIEITTKEEEQARAEETVRQAKNGEKAMRDKYLKDNKISSLPLASGLYYIETKAGKGEKVKLGDKVKVHYTGSLLDGTKFDSSLDRGQPFEFEAGKGRVIKGWDEAILLMRKGGKARLIIPSSIAYGERGSGEKIGPYATLVFEIELLTITSPTDE